MRSASVEGLDAVMVPKAALDSVVCGLPSLVWLSTLKYSARNSTVVALKTGNVRTTAASQLV